MEVEPAVPAPPAPPAEDTARNEALAEYRRVLIQHKEAEARVSCNRCIPALKAFELQI